MTGDAVKLFSVLVLLFALYKSEDENLYRVLSVSRSATSSEIKTAYRKLARQWHPDKNKSPNAKDNFIRINSAYKILSDSQKRQRYDLTGKVDDTQPRSSHGGQHGFTFFQAGNGFQFSFFGGGSRKEDGISASDFFGKILAGSHKRIYLVYFYHEFCMECMAVDRVWKELKNSLGTLGVSMGTVHTSYQPKITRHCGVNGVPTIVGVVSGHVMHYSGHIRNSQSIKDFIMTLVPSQLVTKLTDDTSAAVFLTEAISRNRPRVILVSHFPSPSLSYLLVAFSLHKTLDFAYVSTAVGESGVGIAIGGMQFRIGEKKLLVFKEDPLPVLTKNTLKLDHRQLSSLVEKMTLYLPRISSPAMFDVVCPIDSTRLCSVLVVDDPSHYNDTLTGAYRDMARTRAHPGFVSLAYIHGTSQMDFLGNFGQVTGETAEACKNKEETARKILLLKRISSDNVQYNWFNSYCGDSSTLSTHFHAKGLWRAILDGQIMDEEAPGWFGRLLDTLENYYYSIYHAIDMQNLFFLLSLVVTCTLVCVVSILSHAQEEQDEEAERCRLKHRRGVLRAGSQPRVLIPFGAHSYTGMVQTPVQGLLTLVVFAEGEEILDTFERILRQHRYSNLKTFYLNCRSHGDWLGMILRHCVNLDAEEVAVRVRACKSGCVATAVCLIGSRHQALLFPSKYEMVCALMCKKGGQKRRVSGAKSVGQKLGSTLGYETESSECEEEGDTHLGTSSTYMSHNKCEGTECDRGALMHQVTRGFMHWLERLADGSLRRYKIEEWPDWTDGT